MEPVKDANKAFLTFHTDHSRGSLAKVLTLIADAGINLSKLQSYPIPGSDWKYSFHADMEFENRSEFENVIEDYQAGHFRPENVRGLSKRNECLTLNGKRRTCKRINDKKMETAKRLEGIGEYYFSKKLREIEELNREGKNIISLGIGSPGSGSASDR